MTNQRLRIAGVVIACLVISASIINTTKLVSANGCVDLRCRTVGARLSHSVHSAYFYKWNEKDGDFFLDPNDKPGRIVNGNVVTPAVFQVVYFLSTFRYGIVKVVWTILQYLFLLASLFLLSDRKKSQASNDLLAIVIVIACYGYSNVWFYNIERGQVYTFYLFIISLIYSLGKSQWKYGMFMSGFVNTAAIFIRPLTGVFLLAGVFKRNKNWMAGCVCGAVAGFLVLYLPVARQWKDYFTAMQVYSAEMYTKQTPLPATARIPAVIEGETNLQKYEPRFVCGGLTTVQYYLATQRIHTTSMVLALCFFVVAAGCFVLYANTKPWLQDEDDIFLFAFLLYILAELFIVGYRGGYNQVEWVFAVFVMCRKKELPKFLLVAIVGAIVLQNVQLNIIRFQFELAEMLLIGVLFYLVVARKYIKGIPQAQL